MNFARILLNFALGALGGVLGNLLAAWLLQDVWRNTFTAPRLLGTIGGFVLVYLLLAWLDQRAQNRAQQGTPGVGGQAAAEPPGVHGNIQIGNPVIRVLRGTNVYGNVQIGGGTIEVVERSGASRPPDTSRHQ